MLVDYAGSDPVFSGPPNFQGSRQVSVQPVPGGQSPSILPKGNEQTTISMPLVWVSADEAASWETVLDWCASLPTTVADVILETYDLATGAKRKEYTFPNGVLTAFPATAESMTSQATLSITAGKLVITGEPLATGVPFGHWIPTFGSITQTFGSL
jgi:hypothetical protein